MTPLQNPDIEGAVGMKVPLAKPWIGEEESRPAEEVVRSRWLIQGARVAAFEDRFAARIGARHAIAVNSGSSALLVAMGALGEPGGIHAIAADAESVRSMLSAVSDNFELTILDLPPVSESIIGPAMAKALDGVVLVVEAERTRAAAVQATQRTIKMHGGNVLGVVLNKRRFHIPNFIYRRL